MEAGRSRRRGRELKDAILQAAWDELTEVGWTRLSLDGIARRAGAGRASLYRHWPDKGTLVVEAMLRAAEHGVGVTTPTGDLRADLVAFLTGTSERLAGPMGTVSRGLVAEAPSAAHRDHFARMAAVPVSEVRGILRAAGLDDATLPQRTVNLGTDLLVHAFLLSGAAPGDEVVAQIVDDVWLPVLRAHLGDLGRRRTTNRR